ncbi:LuxR C-terminal-related transcriptional regulator [Adlercreutzia sp. CNCM I-6215]
MSDNTARAHVKHIYQKLGVHSREELLDFIESLK